MWGAPDPDETDGPAPVPVPLRLSLDPRVINDGLVHLRRDEAVRAGCIDVRAGQVHICLDGQPVAIETYVHLPSAHVEAARAAGLVASEMYEAVIDEAWIRRKPKWDRYRGWPISFVWAWRTSP